MTADRPKTPAGSEAMDQPTPARPRTARFQCGNDRCRQVLKPIDDGTCENAPCGHCSPWPPCPPSKIKGRLHRLAPGVRAKEKKREPRKTKPADRRKF